MSNMSFYPEQISAAKNILRVFTIGVIRYALLMAFCQSGKSGAFHFLIRLMLQQGIIQHAYILCGSSETILRDQAKDDAKKFNPEYYKDNNTGAIQVYFRQDFEKITMNVVNTLIVVDESHLDQGQNQMLATFLVSHGGISMDGNPVPLKEKNTFFLSVDATPYAELAALEHKESYPKHVETLVPGSGYYGLAQYNFDGRLNETFSIASQPIRFAKLLKEYPKKYALLRLTNKGKNSKEDEEKVLEVCQKWGLSVCYYLEGKKEIAITKKEKVELRLKASLEDEPEKTTVVIFRETLRAGKVVPKQHIGFVWEGSANGKTDSLVQGLPGRMCGYDFNKDGSKPMLFVPPSSLKENLTKVIKASEMMRAIISGLVLPQKATNLKKVHIAAAPTNGTTECPPLRLCWDEEDDDWTFTDKFDEDYSHGEDRTDIGTRCHKVLSKNLDLIRNCPNYSVEQKAEILKQISIPLLSENFTLRNLHDASQINWFKKLLTGHEKGTNTGEIIDGCRPLNFVVTYHGYKAPGANRKYLYVVFYTKAGAKVGMEQFPLGYRVAPTNGKSHFSIHDSSTSEPAVAGGIAAMKADNIKNPDSLRAFLDEYMTQWKNSPNIMYSRSIVCNKDAFRFSTKTFPGGKKDVESICSQLGTKFGVKMSVKGKKGRVTEGFFNLAEISW
jgi:hypothetical protein